MPPLELACWEVVRAALDYRACLELPLHTSDREAYIRVSLGELLARLEEVEALPDFRRTLLVNS